MHELAQRPTPNAQRPTPNAQRPTPDAQRPTPNAQRPTLTSGLVAVNSTRGFHQFLIENKIGCIVVSAIYLLVNLAIGLNYIPYVDDNNRLQSGIRDWALAGSRLGSELLAIVLNQGPRVVDLGIAFNLLTTIILSFTSVLMIYILGFRDRISLIIFAVATTVGINPWMMNVLFFRVDAPLITIAFLVATLPVLWLDSGPLRSITASAASAWVIFNFYETAWSLYLCLWLTIALIRFLAGTPTKRNAWTLGTALVGFGGGVALSATQLAIQARFFRVFNQAGTGFHPYNALRILYQYLQHIRWDSTLPWLLCYLLLGATFCLTALTSARPVAKVALAIAVYVILAIPATASFWLLFDTPRIVVYPRYMVAFPMWVSIITLVALMWRRGRATTVLTSILGVWLIYNSVTFAFATVAAANYQKRHFEMQAGVLLADLSGIYELGDKVHIDPIFPFEQDAIVQNTARKYPMLVRILNPIAWNEQLSILSGYDASLDGWEAVLDRTFWGPSAECLATYSDKTLLELRTALWDIYRIQPDAGPGLVCVVRSGLS